MILAEANDETYQALNKAMSDAFRARVEQMGDKESGAYGFYLVRIERDEVLLKREWDLARIIHDNAPEAEVHEIGPGAATLAIACAALGHRCVAVERDRRRADAASALADACRPVDPEIPRRMRVLTEHFPSRPLESLRRKARKPMVVATNFISSIPEEEEPAMIEALGRYDTALIDMFRFRVQRSEPEAREALKERILAAGFTRADEVLAYKDCQYLLFS